MAGGYTGKVKKVTDDDIQIAKEILTKKTTKNMFKKIIEPVRLTISSS
jgi:preprotein translocase subunit YajC